jgi:capsid protein
MMAKRVRDQMTLTSAMEGLRADYSAAKASRLRRKRSGVPAAGAGADYHYRSDADYLRLMELARDMDRNDLLVGSILDRAVSNAIQDGIQIDPQTKDEGLNADLKARFAAWAEDANQCDLAKERSLRQMQWLALRHMMLDGDLVCLANRSGAIEMVEAHRMRTPRNTTKNVVHGVLVDQVTRERREYWLTRDDIDPFKTLSRVQDVKRYPARDDQGNLQVYHVYHPKRISQTRGVTAFAPIFDAAGMFEDINFAKLVQQQMVACFAIIEERQIEFKVPTSGNESPIGPQTQEMDADGVPRTLEGMGPGMRIKGAPGSKIRIDSANVPNPEFFPHMRMIIQLISINLGMPLTLALMDASETNFSGWRGAMDQAKIGFQLNQQTIYERLVAPVYHWQVRRWIQQDVTLRRLYDVLGPAIFAHEPGFPTWPYVEPLKDASADLLQTRNALLSHRRRCARRNLDWDDLSTEIVEDNAKLIRKAQQMADALNQEFPSLSVTWRELACLPTPDGMTVSTAVDMSGDDGGRSKREEANNAA